MKKDKNRNKRSWFRRDTRKRKDVRNQSRGRKRDKDRKKDNKNQVICRICNHPIVNMKTALKHPEGGFVHFDCALREISSKEDLKEGEEIYYVGGGYFAVVSNVKYSKGGSLINFKVERKIQYELREEQDR